MSFRSGRLEDQVTIRMASLLKMWAEQPEFPKNTPEDTTLFRKVKNVERIFPLYVAPVPICIALNIIRRSRNLAPLPFGPTVLGTMGRTSIYFFIFMSSLQVVRAAYQSFFFESLRTHGSLGAASRYLVTAGNVAPMAARAGVDLGGFDDSQQVLPQPPPAVVAHLNIIRNRPEIQQLQQLPPGSVRFTGGEQYASTYAQAPTRGPLDPPGYTPASSMGAPMGAGSPPNMGAEGPPPFAGAESGSRSGLSRTPMFGGPPGASGGFGGAPTSTRGGGSTGGDTTIEVK
eukprot:TRINITY_DN67747_c0_g1_i1.p1 TRINITY_DN67747_c0_g1~~TRINITY_DN67747_c0_g1_i1.p1  ORF type:complete len:287 (+),score=46.71 TRINITY_DN67747_c0_g1_i1:252-1112(+)